jgi:hypothetical protein
MLLTNLFCRYKDGVLTVQRAPYIEDGWYIEIDSSIRVYEIPQFGGESELIATAPSLEAAFEIVKELK